MQASQTPSAQINKEFFTEKDRVRERSKMLALVENTPRQNLDIQGMASAPTKSKEFLNFFTQNIWPVLATREELGIRASALFTALDRALYDDDAEKERWIKLKEAAESEIQRLATDPKWQADVKRWAELSEGLTGDIADWSRRMWHDIELGEFSQKDLPLLNRLIQISSELSNLSNTSPFVPKLAPTEKAVNDLVQGYFEKKISFNDAWQGIESYQKDGRTAHGQDVATRGRALLQEAAVIRTKLARSKGFDTWSDYVMAQQARHYAPGFKTAEDKISFLRGLLAATKEPYVKFLEKQVSTIPGLSRQNLRRSQLALIKLEDDTLIRPYFALERIEDEWKKAMTASGFTPRALNTVYLDGYPRPKKYTHAYMNNVSSHAPKTLSISAANLNVTSALPNIFTTEDTWFDAQIYIVQNYRDDGPNAWTTAFHEGGHAMDYVHQEDLLGYGAAYGYTETHSMMMERFFEDIEYLTTVGRTRSGTPLSRDLAQKYITNSKINRLVSFRVQATQALYDLELWKFAYTENGEDFVSRATDLYGELITEATQAQGFTIDNTDWRMNSFATSHFYGGAVRYFGYIVADMAAQLSAEALWRDFEKETGRRTLLNQPTLAKKLIEGYYRRGFLEEFPRSIERFTGMKFSPDSIVTDMLKTVESYKPM